MEGDQCDGKVSRRSERRRATEHRREAADDDYDYEFHEQYEIDDVPGDEYGEASSSSSMPWELQQRRIRRGGSGGEKGGGARDGKPPASRMRMRSRSNQHKEEDADSEVTRRQQRRRPPESRQASRAAAVSPVVVGVPNSARMNSDQIFATPPPPPSSSDLPSTATPFTTNSSNSSDGGGGGTSLFGVQSGFGVDMAVSKGGLKLSFSEGERVLCYDPNPTKPSILYNAEVLYVHPTRDSHGQKLTQYLIHFQGWNSCRNRRVSEDLLLKDTDENRLLQNELAAKAHVNVQGKAAGVARRTAQKQRRSTQRTPGVTHAEAGGKSERGQKGRPTQLQQYHNTSMEQSPQRQKKRVPNRPVALTDHEKRELRAIALAKWNAMLDAEEDSDESDSTEESEKSSDSTSNLDDDDDDDPIMPDPDAEAEADSGTQVENAMRERVPLQLPEALKHILERDFDFVAKRGRIVRLPAEPNVVHILESYVKDFAWNQICGEEETQGGETGSHHYHHHSEPAGAEEIKTVAMKYV